MDLDPPGPSLKHRSQQIQHSRYSLTFQVFIDIPDSKPLNVLFTDIPGRKPLNILFTDIPGSKPLRGLFTDIPGSKPLNCAIH